MAVGFVFMMEEFQILLQNLYCAEFNSDFYDIFNYLALLLYMDCAIKSAEQKCSKDNRFAYLILQRISYSKPELIKKNHWWFILLLEM